MTTRRSFGTDLQQFARSIDIIDDVTWRELGDLVESYVLNEFGMAYFEFMAEDEIDGEIGLRSQWISEGDERSKRLRDNAGNYNGQTAYAFDVGDPLWIVHADGDVLSAEMPREKCREMWSNHDMDLPAYSSTINNIRTSIILPVRQGRRVVGVLDFEDQAHRVFNPVAEVELRALAAAIGTAYALRIAHTTQRAGTREAMRTLRDRLTARRFPTSLSRPTVFLASAGGADPAVMEVVRGAIGELSDWVLLADWQASSAGGNITESTLRDIATARFGVCYLSEPGDGALLFRDNANVVFEAGMLHALTNIASDAPTEWIPIREHQDLAGPPPFDFAQERIVIVPRDGDGAVDAPALATQLDQRLRQLIGL